MCSYCSRMYLHVHASLMPSAAPVKLPPRKTLSVSRFSMALSTAPRHVKVMGSWSCLKAGSLSRTFGCRAVHVDAPRPPPFIISPPTGKRHNGSSMLLFKIYWARAFTWLSFQTCKSMFDPLRIWKECGNTTIKRSSLVHCLWWYLGATTKCVSVRPHTLRIFPGPSLWPFPFLHVTHVVQASPAVSAPHKAPRTALCYHPSWTPPPAALDLELALWSLARLSGHHRALDAPSQLHASVSRLWWGASLGHWLQSQPGHDRGKRKSSAFRQLQLRAVVQERPKNWWFR